MDGDISVDSEPGMGSQFTLRIPLYGFSIRRKGVEGLAGTRCWLAVRNASLYRFVESSLMRSGVTVLRYEGSARMLMTCWLPTMCWNRRGKDVPR